MVINTRKKTKEVKQYHLLLSHQGSRRQEIEVTGWVLKYKEQELIHSKLVRRGVAG